MGLRELLDEMKGIGSRVKGCTVGPGKGARNTVEGEESRLKSRDALCLFSSALPKRAYSGRQ